MEKTGHKNGLFLASGCLSGDGLRRFVSEELSTPDKQKVELHVADCIFCTEAVKGHKLFLQRNTVDELEETANQLEKHVDELINRHKLTEKKEDKYRIRSGTVTWLSVAAACVMFFGIYFTYSHYFSKTDKGDLAVFTTSNDGNSSNLSAPPDNSAVDNTKKTTSNTNSPSGISQGQQNTNLLNSQNNLNEIQNHSGVNSQGTSSPEMDEATGLSTQKETQVDPSGNKVVLNQSKQNQQKKAEEALEANSSQIYTVVEEMPAFPGGEAARMRFLQNNTVFPQTARENGISGTVFVSFLVEKTGKIKNIKILKGIGSGCDEEAIKVVKKMPDWIPGKQAGKPVGVQFSMPIKFSPR